MKVIILCGGQGTRLKEETEYKPKPMVEIGARPIVWHIMKLFSHYGFDEFILALGYKGNVIKDYFLNYEYHNKDLTVTLGKHKDVQLHGFTSEAHWKITMVETGLNSMTGYRVKQCGKYIDEDHFILTYSDGLANINIRALVDYHVEQDKIGTLASVNPTSRFGELAIKDNVVMEFLEKPVLKDGSGAINGGFMVFKREFLDKYLTDDPNFVLEREPLFNLASDRELVAYRHRGFWQCMDTYRDFLQLQNLWETGAAPWEPT